MKYEPVDSKLSMYRQQVGKNKTFWEESVEQFQSLLHVDFFSLTH